MAWVAKHINEQVLFHPRDVVTATEFNSLFNLLIAQGNNNAQGVESLIGIFGSVTDGESGADYVKVTPVSGVTGTNVQETLEGLKGLVDQRYTKSETDILLGGKASNEVVAKLIRNVQFEEGTGKFTFVFQDGTTKVIDTALEKVTVNFFYNAETQSLVLEYADGSMESISLAEFVTNNEFEDSDTINISVVDGIVKAEIGVGVITDEMLSSTLLATLVGYVSSASGSAQAAASSETNAGTYAQTASNAADTAAQKAKSASDSASEAEDYSKMAESYARGGTDSRPDEDIDNAKYYSEVANTKASAAAESAQEAKEYRDQAEEIVGGNYASKVVPARAGNLAALGADGNLQDSGKAPEAFVLQSAFNQFSQEYELAQAAVESEIQKRGLTAKFLIGSLSVSGWVDAGTSGGYKQTLSVTGIEINGYSYIVYPDYSLMKTWAASGIYASDITAANEITLYCKKKPSIDINVYILKEQTVGAAGDVINATGGGGGSAEKSTANKYMYLVATEDGSEMNYSEKAYINPSTGYLHAERVYNAVWNDYAELFEKEDSEDIFEAGDIVAWEDIGVVKAQYQNHAVVGVVSDSYGHLLGGTGDEEDDNKRFVPVGLAGRVRVKVTGKVEKGDFIAAYHDGIGVANNKADPRLIVGKALESSDDYDVKLVKILIR